MPVTHASFAVILRTRAYGESDRIVTFLTEDAGKLTGIAKGARNSRRRFANCLDPLTRVRAYYRVRPGAGLVFLESCDLLVPAGELCEPRRFAYASYLLELVDLLTEEAHAVPGTYGLLVAALDELRSGVATADFLRRFEVRLLTDAGYEPQFVVCGLCSTPLSEGAAVAFEPRRELFLCPTCRPSAGEALSLQGATLHALEAFKSESASRPGVVLRRDMAVEAVHLLSLLLAPHLRRPLRSVALIQALAP